MEYDFLFISLLSLILIFWIVAFLPDFAIEKKSKSTPFKTILSSQIIRKILMVTLCWILAHNLLYTYIAPFLEVNGLSENVDWLLFLFGISSIIAPVYAPRYR